MATWAGPIRITRTGGAAPISFVEGAADACALRGSKRPSRPGGDRRTASRARYYARRTRRSLCANDDDLGNGPRPRLVDRSLDERVVGIARDASHSPSLLTNQTEPDHDPASPAAEKEKARGGRRDPYGRHEPRRGGRSRMQRWRSPGATRTLLASPPGGICGRTFNHFLRTKAGAAWIGPSLAPRNRIGTVVG